LRVGAGYIIDEEYLRRNTRHDIHKIVVRIFRMPHAIMAIGAGNAL
jgi:hypothetical protein